MWALAAFFVGARLFSLTGGLMLAMAVFVTALTYVASSRMQEMRARNLAEGTCPRCRAPVLFEHKHRRWDASNRVWLAPLMSWRCAACGFQQEEALACEACRSTNP
jgi:hypothetical protein